jgi:hypothetical protein
MQLQLPLDDATDEPITTTIYPSGKPITIPVRIGHLRTGHGTYTCPCCGTEGTLQELEDNNHLSLSDPRTWTDELIACTNTRNNARHLVKHYTGPIPEEYTRATIINPDGTRFYHSYMWYGVVHTEQPAWRCPICERGELSMAELAASHGVFPWDPESWARPRCWSATAHLSAARRRRRPTT